MSGIAYFLIDLFVMCAMTLCGYLLGRHRGFTKGYTQAMTEANNMEGPP